MKIMKYLLLFILFSLSHTTNRNILEDHHTLQKGINKSSDYDVVVISEKKYNDTLNISQVVRPFNFIEISIQLTRNINHNTFHQFYESQNGLKTSISTPFYWGDIQASVQILPFFGLEKDYIDFIGIHPNINVVQVFTYLKNYDGIMLLELVIIFFIFLNHYIYHMKYLILASQKVN